MAAPVATVRASQRLHSEPGSLFRGQASEDPQYRTANTEQPSRTDDGQPHPAGAAARARGHAPCGIAHRLRPCAMLAHRRRGVSAVHCSLQHIFERHFDAFARTRALHPREWRAAHAIRHCYGSALGSHLLYCPNGHFQQIQPHACRHRSCPRERSAQRGQER